jgi:hypothetical protein
MAYGTREHEEWLILMERQDVPDERPDQPWTPCGCTARAYGGDCAHTIDPVWELYGGHLPACEGTCDPSCPIGQERAAEARARAARAQALRDSRA